MDNQLNIQVQDQQQLDIKLTSFLKGHNIQLGKRLGEGYFSEVFEGFDDDLQQKVAIKRLKDLDNLKKFEDEKDTMQKIKNHQYAIQIFKYLHDQDLGLSMIVMEFCDCTLTEIFAKNSQNFTFEQLLALSYQLLKGLLVFQEKGIIHGDLKPDNILYNQQKNAFLISDLGLSQIIENPELQQLISKQSSQHNGGNLKYMSPDVAYNIKPFTIKIDVFSIGQILLEFLLKRELIFAEFLKLKTENLLSAIPELKHNQSQEFVQKILENMVCPKSEQRLESITLLQKINQFKVDEDCLKSLIFSGKNTSKINSGINSNKIVINTNLELYQFLQSIQNNNVNFDPNNPQSSKYQLQAIQLSTINLIVPKQIKSICITNENMNENLNLKKYDEVKLDFNNSLSYQKSCFCLESLNIVNAITKISKEKGITAMIIDLEKNQMTQQKAQSIANSLMKCQHLTSIKINLDQKYFDRVEIKNILCFLRACQQFESFEIELNNQEDFFKFEKQNDQIKITLKLGKLMSDELIYEERISTIINEIQSQNIQTFLNFSLNQKQIDDKKAYIIAKSIKSYKNMTELSLGLSFNSIGDKGAEYISYALQNQHNLTKLELYLANNQIGFQGAEKFSESLKNFKNLNYFILELGKNQITHIGAKYLAGAIEEYQNIKQLVLGLDYNLFRVEGTQNFAKSIQNYEEITCLTISLVNNSIGDEGVKSIAEAIQKKKKINNLKLQLKNNYFGSTGANHIANAIKNYQDTKQLLLGLENNKIGNEGAQSISDSLKNYEKLTKLDLYLNNNGISQDFKTNMEKQFQNVILENKAFSVSNLVKSIKVNKQEQKSIEIDNQLKTQVQRQSQQKMDIDLSSFLLASNIQLGKKLGEGYFAEVFEGYDHDHQRKVAIKKLKDLNNLKKFEEEKEAMLKIQNHQYAIQLFKYLHDVDRGYSMIIMEFCDCNLTEIFQKNSQNFTFEQLVALSYQLLKGLLVFQEKGIIHGDLKPDNILYNQQKNIFLISDLGLSQIIENPELQQLISKQSKQQNGGNFKYMAPEVAHNIKPFTIKIDVFSLGQILLEFLLKRELSMSEFLKLKEYDLLDRIPELKQHQNYKFVEEILVKMVCHQSMQRLESITLLQKLNQFKVNEEYLKSLIFSNKNAQQIIQEASQKQLVTNTNEEVYQQLVTLPNNDDKKEPKKNQNLQQTIQLSNINLVEKKQIKSICITNENMKENLNLENYQEVKLDFNNSLSMQKNCFCIENLNIVNAIRKIQKINGITAMIVDLKKNQMSLQKAQSISNSLMKCQNLTSIKIDLDQGYFDNEEINNIMCFLRACQNFSSFEINIDNNNIDKDFKKNIEKQLKGINLKVEV
ncbi:hypothetical protein ABPG74_006692 [Tetrahymena malaccensis]